MTKMRFGLATLSTLLVALTAYAGDEPAPKPAPSTAALNATYKQIHQQVLDTYVGTLPPGWNDWPRRFNDKLDVNGNLRVAVDVMLSSVADNRLRLLSTKDVEAYKCRPESGYVGVGVMFQFQLTMEKGFPVEKVLDSSPAKAAKLRSGMTIVAINGNRLKGSDLVDSLTLLLGSDPEVKLTVLDGEQESDVVVNRKKGDKLGFEYSFGKTLMTVTVGKVLANSPAEKAGLRPGEVITKVNNNTVSNGDPDWFNDQTGGRLGEVIGLTVVRDNAEVNLKLQRSVVVNEQQSFDLGTARSASLSELTLTLTNLDWTKIVDSVDKSVGEINRRASCTVDLRKASGDNPELAARLAARFIQTLDGDLLCYREIQGGQEKTTRYFLARRDGKSTLISECGGVETVIEQAPQAVTCKLTVLVDEFTSGTAEALALALQRSGRATINGTETANRSDLVESRTFTSGDAQIVIEVPVRRLVPGTGYKSLTIKPDQRKASAGDAGLPLLALGVLIWLSMVYSAYRLLRRAHPVEQAEPNASSTSNRTFKPVKLALVVVALLAGLWCIFFGLREASAPKAEAPKAAAYITNILRTDEESRTNRLRHANADRGKLDAKANWGEEHPPTADAEIEAACRIAEAITQGDFDTVKEMIVSYAHKPYARAQIAMSLNHAFNKAGVDFYIMFYNGMFMIENSRLDDGQARVIFTPLEAPTVNVMVANPTSAGSFTSTENAAMFEAREVFATLRAPLVRAVQETRAQGK